MMSSVTIERKRVECNSLPKGWQREEIIRKSGISAGKMDVCYYSPTGRKIESKPQLARQLGDAFDLSTFDFQTGKILQHLSSPSISLYRCSGSGAASSTANTGANTFKRKYKSQTLSDSSSGSSTASINISTNNTSSASFASSSCQRQLHDFSRTMRSDVSLVPPIRQTASIFKQPVTVIRNHEVGKVKHDAKHAAQDKPKQMFWEKRLERLRACHSSGEELEDIILPRSIRSIGPNVNEQTVLHSLATALHILSSPVTGQTSSKTEFNKNATAFINPDQPLMQSVLVSEDDIRRQEDRVNIARKKLQDALKS
ncbi:methyl-CpG-binding domain protein 2 isoform X1 [Teleopsis dalmanni]|uniref:methyl-CpG-binding domain protein 2 isoform X1 n=1 Tax=Teleopsis dalmanni TaxID=139649 RepID=UPI000D329541|nr:methyl-CpG-binding domain protein 2 isoform X1 [Teleopsis dalmanni]